MEVAEAYAFQQLIPDDARVADKDVLPTGGSEDGTQLVGGTKGCDGHEMAAINVVLR